jgi:hypothetical protein
MSTFGHLFLENDKKQEIINHTASEYKETLKKALVDMMLPSFIGYIEDINPSDNIRLYGNENLGHISFTVAIVGNSKCSTLFRGNELANWREKNKEVLDRLDITYSNEHMQFHWENYVVAYKNDGYYEESQFLIKISKFIEKEITKKYPGSRFHLSSGKANYGTEKRTFLEAHFNIEHRSSIWVDEQERKVKESKEFFQEAKNILRSYIPKSLKQSFENDKKLKTYERKVSTSYQSKYYRGETIAIKYTATFLSTYKKEKNLIDLSSLFCSYQNWYILLLSKLPRTNEYEEEVAAAREAMYKSLEKELCTLVSLPVYDLRNLDCREYAINVHFSGYGYLKTPMYDDDLSFTDNKLECTIEVTGLMQ